MTGTLPRGIKVLVSAYACNPEMGSEAGAGWHLVREIAAVAGEVTVLVRSNDVVRARSYAGELSNVKFVPVDLGPTVLRLKRKLPGVRWYYLLWQVKAGIVGRRLDRAQPFDVVHHLTWASASMFSGMSLVGRPMVLGPAGGFVPPIWRLVEARSVRVLGYELFRWVNQALARVNPLVRWTWSQTHVVLGQNRETVHAFRGGACRNICTNAGVADREIRAGGEDFRDDVETLRLVYVGRLVAYKGLGLAIEALATGIWGEAVTLTVVGEGPQEVWYRKLAERRGVADKVKFTGKMSRDALLALLDECDVAVLPAHREEGAPFTVIEAMARGVRIVALDAGGPAVSINAGGVRVRPDGGRRKVVQRIVNAVMVAADIDRGVAVENAKSFVWQTRRRVLSEAYVDAMDRYKSQEAELSGAGLGQWVRQPDREG